MVYVSDVRARFRPRRVIRRPRVISVLKPIPSAVASALRMFLNRHSTTRGEITATRPLTVNLKNAAVSESARDRLLDFGHAGASFFRTAARPLPLLQS